MKHSILLITISLFFLSGCNIAIDTNNSNSLLIVDDFTAPNLQWDVWEREDGSRISYYEDGLIFFIKSENVDFVSTLNSNLKNAKIETLASKVVGPSNNSYGVVCRYKDENNYYAFLISSDQYYSIVKVENAEFVLLNDIAMQFSERIHSGEQSNHIRADCIENELSLYVNNELLARVNDDSFQNGKVGLIAGSFDEAGIAILFDNFLVTNP